MLFKADGSIACRVKFVFKTALYTIATAPQESWRSVKVTAAAAAALILDPAARAVRDSTPEVLEEAEADPQSQTQDGPVGRAKERWKEARNEMPEVMFALPEDFF